MSAQNTRSLQKITSECSTLHREKYPPLALARFVMWIDFSPARLILCHEIFIDCRHVSWFTHRIWVCSKLYNKMIIVVFKAMLSLTAKFQKMNDMSCISWTRRYCCVCGLLWLKKYLRVILFSLETPSCDWFLQNRCTQPDLCTRAIAHQPNAAKGEERHNRKLG